MKNALILLHICGTVSAIYSIILPSHRAPFDTSTLDEPWECATEDVEQYFDMPTPTGDLLDILFTYENSLPFPTCTSSGIAVFDCPSIEPSQWCAFPTAAPKFILRQWSSYGSAASSWWAESSSAAVSVAQKCPESWYWLRWSTINGQAWFNKTIITGQCYADAQNTPSMPIITSGTSATNLDTRPSSTMVPIETGSRSDGFPTTSTRSADSSNPSSLTMSAAQTTDGTRSYTTSTGTHSSLSGSASASVVPTQPNGAFGQIINKELTMIAGLVSVAAILIFVV